MLPDPEFLQAAERRLGALSREFTFETRHEIPALWNDFWSRDWPLNGAEEQAAYGYISQRSNRRDAIAHFGQSSHARGFQLLQGRRNGTARQHLYFNLSAGQLLYILGIQFRHIRVQRDACRPGGGHFPLKNFSRRRTGNK